MSQLLLGGHLLKVIVEDAVVLHGLDRVDVLVQDWFKLLDIVCVNFEMDESVAEGRLAIG